MSELNVAPIGSINNTLEVKGPQKQDKAEEGSFGQWLARSLSQVSQLQDVSDNSSQKLITGQSTDIHGTMIAMQKAGIALDLVVEIRNKVIAAYDEVKRMQF
jgi:flagellar hook-basal body complex protein FliE